MLTLLFAIQGISKEEQAEAFRRAGLPGDFAFALTPDVHCVRTTPLPHPVVRCPAVPASLAAPTPGNSTAAAAAVAGGGTAASPFPFTQQAPGSGTAGYGGYAQPGGYPMQQPGGMPYGVQPGAMMPYGAPGMMPLPPPAVRIDTKC